MIEQEEIIYWSKKIAEADYRSAHPEDYEKKANELLLKKRSAIIIFGRIIALTKGIDCSTSDCFSFENFWNYIMRNEP